MINNEDIDLNNGDSESDAPQLSRLINGDDQFRKPKGLITGFSGVAVADDFETKMSFVGQLKFQRGDFVESDAAYEVIVHVGDILDYVKMNRNEVYKEMAALQIRMHEKIYSFVNEITGEVKTRSLIIGTDYRNGDFKIQYHKQMKDILLAEKNFALLQVKTYQSLQKTASCNLYEQLKIKYYRKTDRCIRDGRFVRTIGLSELRIKLSTVEITSELQRELNKKKVDWDYIIEKSPKVRNENYTRFKSRVLLVAIDELLRCSEFDELTIKEVKKGVGAKVCAIEFRWHDTLLDEIGQDNTESRPVGVETIVEGNSDDPVIYTKIREGKELSIYDECAKIFDGILKADGEALVDINFAQQLCEACGCDMGALRKAKDYYISVDDSKKENPRGWLMACLTEKWYGRVNSLYKSSAAKAGGGSNNSFLNYKQREIDFAALEAKVFAHQNEPAKPDIVVDAVEVVGESAKSGVTRESSFIKFNNKILEYNEAEVIRQLEDERQASEVLPDDWEFELLPNGKVRYMEEDMDYEFARENCPLSSSMVRKLTAKFGLLPTSNRYVYDYVFIERIGGSFDDIESYPKVVRDVAKNIGDTSKGLDSLVEYAIDKVEEKGLKFSGKKGDEGADRYFVMSVSKTIEGAIDWAFEKCISLG